METSTAPKTWLTESILVTLFCFLPLGIAGIVYASQVQSKWRNGDIEGAEKASKEARQWTLAGFWIGLALIVFGFLVNLTGEMNF